MHLACLGFTRLKKTQRFRDRDLIDQYLVFSERCFRDSMPGLDQARIRCFFSGGDPGCSFKKTSDGNGVCSIIRSLVNHFDAIIRYKAGGGYLNTASSPAIRHGHLTRRKGHLISRYRHSFEQSTTDHAFGLLIKISKIVTVLKREVVLDFRMRCHSPASSMRASRRI